MGWPPLLYADFQAKEDCVLALLEPRPQQLVYLSRLMRTGSAEHQTKVAERLRSIITGTMRAGVLLQAGNCFSPLSVPKFLM